MLNSLLTNRYLLQLIRDYVQFQFDNNTHIAAIDGIKPTYTYSITDAMTRPVVTFIDNSPAPEGNTYIFKTLLDDDKEYQDFVKSIPITTYHTLGLFSCNKDERIYRIHTGSTTSNHSNYYLPVYNKIQSSVDLPDGNYNLMDPSTGKSTGKLNVGADGIKIGTPDINTGKANGLAPDPRQELLLMPNPATDYVKVSLNPSNSQPIHVKIVNSQGALVQSLTLENGNDVNNINISALPVGTYYVVVNQNGVTTSNRLVKTIDSSK